MTRMDKSMESTKQSFATVRTGRASPAMLDRIQVRTFEIWRFCAMLVPVC